MLGVVELCTLICGCCSLCIDIYVCRIGAWRVLWKNMCVQRNGWGELPWSLMHARSFRFHTGFVSSDCGAIWDFSERHNYTKSFTESAAAALIGGERGW